MEYGTRIRELRKAQNITSKSLSKKINVAPSFVSAIEHNSTKLSLDTLNKICHALHITLQEFFMEDVTTIEKQLFHRIKSMDEEQQKHLLLFLDSYEQSKS